MPPKQASDLIKCKDNWSSIREHSHVASFPKWPPLPVGGLPQLTFSPRATGSKRPHALLDSPLPHTSPGRRPRSLQREPFQGNLAADSARSATASPKQHVETAAASLTWPTKEPPQICAQSRQKFVSQRSLSLLAKTSWSSWWAQTLEAIGTASQLFCHFRSSDNWNHIVVQSLAHVGASTLDLYSRGIMLLQHWMSLLDVSWEQLDRSHLVDILLRVRVAARQDAHINRIQPQCFVRCLRWLAKTAEIPRLAQLVSSELMGSFLRGSGKVVQLKEALPIPLAVVCAWECALGNDDISNWVKLLLGGFLLAVWASLRFGDLQRCDINSLNLAGSSLRGSCFQTKVTKRGQPFAVTVFGFTASGFSNSWVKFWLQQLQLSSRRVAPFKPDFIIPACSSSHAPAFETPLSYVAALRALRWAIQTPWASPMLSPLEAQQFTLHSLKVTMLSVAAQLRLDERARRLQGHHKVDSVQLYSRDDTVDSLWLQEQISSQVRAGWRPTRPQARGSQRPTPEPAFVLQHSDIPRSHELTADSSLEDFQFVPDVRDYETAKPLWPLQDLSESSSSETASCSDSQSDDEVPEDPLAVPLVTNGPAGCTHAMIPATVLSAAVRTFDVDGSKYMTACGASIRASAFASPPDQLKWPCHKLACRKILDKFLWESCLGILERSSLIFSVGICLPLYFFRGRSRSWFL